MNSWLKCRKCEFVWKPESFREKLWCPGCKRPCNKTATLVLLVGLIGGICMLGLITALILGGKAEETKVAAKKSLPHPEVDVVKKARMVPLNGQPPTTAVQAPAEKKEAVVEKKEEAAKKEDRPAPSSIANATTDHWGKLRDVTEQYNPRIATLGGNIDRTRKKYETSNLTPLELKYAFLDLHKQYSEVATLCNQAGADARNISSDGVDKDIAEATSLYSSKYTLLAALAFFHAQNCLVLAVAAGEQDAQKKLALVTKAVDNQRNIDEKTKDLAEFSTRADKQINQARIQFNERYNANLLPLFY